MTAPDEGIKPVVVEKPKPVVLKKDVNLKGEHLESKLNVQNKVKSIEADKTAKVEDVVKTASVATAGDVSHVDDHVLNYKSPMTLYHWKMFDQDTQL